MSAHLEKTPVPPIQLDPKLPALLNDVILMSVLKDPNARFQTAGAFRNALSAVSGMAAPAPAPVAAVAAKAAPVAAAATAPARSKRGLWMGLGAVAAVLAVIAVIELVPGKGAKAGIDTTAPITSPPAATTPTETVLPQTTPSDPAAAVPSQSAPAQASSSALDPRQVRGSAHPVQAAQSQPPQQAPPQQQISPQPVAQPPAAAAPAPSQAENAVRAELLEVRQQMSMLNVRANGIRGALQRLEGQQSAAGLGLNAKFTGPRDLMNSFMDETADALNAGDPATAKSMMKKAAYQVEQLEKLLNR